ncbi:MAG: hypothetical protein ACLR7D_13325 [Lachnospira eligens]
MIRTPMNSDVSFMVRLKELLKQPENMTWNILGEYADSIDVPAVNRESMQPQVHVVTDTATRNSTVYTSMRHLLCIQLQCRCRLIYRIQDV